MKNKKSEIWYDVILNVLYLLFLYMGSYDLLYSIKKFLFLEDEQHLLSYGYVLSFMSSLFLIMMILGHFAHLFFSKNKEKQDNNS